MVSLAENARIPVDNPATHLELTMIHEAMIARVLGAPPGADRVGGGAQALRLLVHRPRALLPVRHRRGRRLARRSSRAVPVLVVKLAVGGFAAGADRDAVGEDAHLPRARVPRHRVPARRARRCSSTCCWAAEHDRAAALRPAHQPAARRSCCCSRSRCSRSGASCRSSTCSRGRGSRSRCRPAIVAYGTHQPHLYWSAALTLAAQGRAAAVAPAPADPPAQRQAGTSRR